MEVSTLEDDSNWSAIACYHIEIPVVISFRTISHKEQNSKI